MKKKWSDYLWIASLLYLFLGLFHILFAWLGLICFAIATAFFAPVLSGYLATGMVPKFPTLIACSGLYVISFLLWISGVILEVITKKHRQLFELYLNQLSILKRRNG